MFTCQAIYLYLSHLLLLTIQSARWRNWGSKRLNALPKTLQLEIRLNLVPLTPEPRASPPKTSVLIQVSPESPLWFQEIPKCLNQSIWINFINKSNSAYMSHRWSNEVKGKRKACYTAWEAGITPYTLKGRFQVENEMFPPEWLLPWVCEQMPPPFSFGGSINSVAEPDWGDSFQVHDPALRDAGRPSVTEQRVRLIRVR